MTLVLALSTLAFAEEPTFVGAAAPVAATPKPETHLQASAGGNFTAGNSEAVAVNAGLNFTHKWTQNQLGLVGGAAIGFGATDANADGFLAADERCIGVPGNPCASTAERYGIDGRYDRFFTEKSSLYLLAGALHDKFAGFQLRAHVQAGYAAHVIDTKETHLKLEAGVDFANEAYVPGVVPASAKLLAAQVGLGYDHAFNEGVSFNDAFTVYEPVFTQPEGAAFSPHLTDVRIGNVASITAKMTDRLSVSISDTLAWRNEPISAPEGISASRSKVDNTLALNLVASLL